MKSIILIIAHCEILAKYNNHEILSIKNEYKEISAVPWKQFNENNKLGLDIVLPVSYNYIAENNRNTIHI
jgi:hypothetical protein